MMGICAERSTLEAGQVKEQGHIHTVKRILRQMNMRKHGGVSTLQINDSVDVTPIDSV